MLALVNTPDSADPVELREAAEPAPDETLVDVRAFSLYVVLQEAADSGGPPKSARLVGLVDGAGWL